jgi:alcohol dehydrogenase class IV
MRFDFMAPGRIVFGPQTSSRLPEIARGFGERPLVVTGANPARQDALVASLSAAGLSPHVFSVAGEPTVSKAVEAAEFARQNGLDFVVSVGGGAAMDAGKAAAALMANGGDIFEYLEVVGKGRAIEKRPAPHVAVPTTAGTGAEATANAVLTVPEKKVKVSLRSPMLMPDVALVDPILSMTMPPKVTAATGLDALTQLLEAFVSVKAWPVTDELCREGMRRAGRSLERAFHDPANAAAREDMAMASLLSGLALANAKLGAVHGFAAAIGGESGAPHGYVCARLLPFVTRANIKALKERLPDSPALAAYAEAARILTGYQDATAEDAAAWLDGLCARLNTPPLSAFGVSETSVEGIVAKTMRASSTKGNPVELTGKELAFVLGQAI